MTIICAMHESGVGTWIASDTLVCVGDTLIGHKKKWIAGDGCALGITGASVVLDILHEHREELRASWSATALFRWAKTLFDGYGFKADPKDGEAPSYEASYLFATPDRVLSIDRAGGGVEFGHKQFASRGSGADIADGAAWVCGNLGMRPQTILGDAVEAAKAFNRNCGGETWIECLRSATDGPVSSLGLPVPGGLTFITR